VHGIGRAFRASEERRAGARSDKDLVLVARDIGDREGDGRIRHVDDHVDAFDVEPVARDLGTDVRFVLVVRREDFHLALRMLSELFCRHLRRDHRSGTLEVGIDARHVVENADPCRAVHLRICRRPHDAEQRSRDSRELEHAILPGMCGRGVRLEQGPLVINATLFEPVCRGP
jgi:hypothetical protein